MHPGSQFIGSYKRARYANLDRVVTKSSHLNGIILPLGILSWERKERLCVCVIFFFFFLSFNKA